MNNLSSILIVSFLFMKSYDFAPSSFEDAWYCRYGTESKICRKCPDLDDLCLRQENDCICDNIELKIDGVFIGGANCVAKDEYDEQYCYVGHNTSCIDKKLSTAAQNMEGIWYPTTDGETQIYSSTEACDNMDMRKKNNIGNEEILNDTRINDDFHNPNRTIKIDLSASEYEESTHQFCKQMCEDENKNDDDITICSAWSFDKENKICYIHNVYACCGQRDKQEKNKSFISGYICPYCWSTRNDCPCDLDVLLGGGKNTQHNNAIIRKLPPPARKN